MGGKGSGGHNKLSDDEKVRRGTFRPDQSENTFTQRAASTIIAGPWLATIPEPDYPLGPVGRSKYDEWTKELFDQGKLTKISATLASSTALLHQKIFKRASEGKEVSANDFAKFQSGLRDLNITQNAKVTASPGKNRWAEAGFANQRSSPIRLRAPAASDPGEL